MQRISVAPFVCKWSDAHPEPKFFETQKELEIHVYDHDYNDIEASFKRHGFYLCPWEGCEAKYQDIDSLKGHLRKHSKQMPFKCPFCNYYQQFRFAGTLNQHLITKHSDNFVDFTGAKDMTKFDPNIYDKEYYAPAKKFIIRNKDEARYELIRQELSKRYPVLAKKLELID